MLFAILATGLLLAQAASPAPAAQPTPQAAPAKVDKPAKPKLVCETEATTDSMIKKRVCRTPEQIEAQRKEGQGVVGATQDHMAACGGRPGC